MNNPTDDAARAAFESWYSDGDLDCPSIRRNPDGGYYLMGAHCGWQAWRAAWLYTSETQSKLEPLLRELIRQRDDKP